MKNNGKKKITSKQIVAMAGIILLVLLYIVTLILAIAGTENSTNLFGICLLDTIFVPIIIWIYTWIYGQLTVKKTMADIQTGTAEGDSKTTEYSADTSDSSEQN